MSKILYNFASLNPFIMPQSLSANYLHLVFSVKNRAPLITHPLDGELYRYLYGILQSMTCVPLIVNGHINHVHCLFGMSKKHSLQWLVQELKRSSTYWVQKEKRKSNFTWQKGYGCFSVSPKELDSVWSYIRNQSEHHQKMTFEEEVQNFMRTYKVEGFEPEYFFDRQK